MTNLRVFVFGASLLVTAHHVLAESGWYLLVPPTSEYDERAEYLSAYKVLEAWPLTGWSHHSAYDSAAACEAAKSSRLEAEQDVSSNAQRVYLNALDEKKNAAGLKSMRRAAETANASVKALLASKCIKSDDPRLAK